MEENTILKIALLVSLTGILVIIFISGSIEVKEYKIKEISKDLIDKEIKVSGIITRITETPGLLILNLKDSTGEITSIIFKEDPINLTENQEIEIQGKVKEYKNKLEIEANLISSEG